MTHLGEADSLFVPPSASAGRVVWHLRYRLDFRVFMHTRDQITRLIAELQEGEPGSWERLLPLVYEELCGIAHRQLLGQRSGHTLDTSALVHEAYLKLADHTRLPCSSRSHFFALASRAMRQVLIGYARRHAAAKRGGHWRRVPLEVSEIAVEERADALLALDEALDRLAAMNERLARVVECRFFGGMTEADTAEALGVTDRTVRRDWIKARIWLYGELHEESA
jgi:RNA polymerase sigma factor (TIGR02999 family)